MAESRFEDLRSFLKAQGHDVYSPSQKEGECTDKYVVVKNQGTTPVSGISSNQTMFDIMCYVPKLKYATLEPFVNKVKTDMKLLYPMFIPTGVETPSYYDDSVKGHMISVQYKNMKQKERM